MILEFEHKHKCVMRVKRENRLLGEGRNIIAAAATRRQETAKGAMVDFAVHLH